MKPETYISFARLFQAARLVSLRYARTTPCINKHSRRSRDVLIMSIQLISLLPCVFAGHLVGRARDWLVRISWLSAVFHQFAES